MLFLRSAAAALVCAVALFGQADANKGQILGTVSDPNGSVVPSATVTIRNTGTGFTRELKTDESGQYRAVLLDPGPYQVVGQSTGFAPTTVAGIVLTVGGAVTADVILRVETTTTTVEVSDSLIQVALPQPTTNINSQAIANLPILGRRFQDFATLTPTVQVDPQRGQLSFAGQRGINANVMLDGTDYNQPFFGGIRGGERSNLAFTLPQSAIQEFQTVTTGYAAEYGRSTGGILNAITRSGANDINGQAFYQIRHKEFGLTNPILNVAPNETLQQFGGGVGGPVIKDRWFWFGALERQLSRIPRTVLFTALQGVQETPENRESLQFFRSEEGPFKQTNDATVLLGRTDYQFAAGHRLTMRFNHSRNTAENGVSVGGALNPISTNALSNEGTERDKIYGGAAQYTHLFSATTLNDTRFSHTYEVRPRESNSALPSITVGSGSLIGRFGATNFLPTTQDDDRMQIVNSTSVSSGSHTLKFGVDYNRLHTFQEFGQNQFGNFILNGSNVERLLDILSPGGNLPRFGHSDVASYQRQVGNLLADFGVQQLAFYAQDSWRAHPSLTLDFGLRWEGQFNPAPDVTNTRLVDTVANARFPFGDGRLDPRTIPDSLKQFMPRFGFAWSPLKGGRSMVVRGHTGIFYAATPLIIMSGHTNNFRSVPGNISISVNPNTQAGQEQTLYDIFQSVGYDLNQGTLSALPIIPIEVVQQAAARRAGVPQVDPFLGVGIDIMASDFRNPRSFQAGFGVESELGGGLTGGIQLNYVNTVNLHRNRDYNLPAPTIRATDGRPIFNRNARPIPTLGPFTVRESSARSMYRGATLQLQYRRSRLQFGANYTLSETFSDSDLERDAGGSDYQNAFDFSRDYNYSRLDARHQFNGYGVVTLPWGFEVSSIVRARSGYPLNSTVGSDLNQDTLNTDRPFVAPGVVVERNSYRNRGIAQTDLRILKDFRVGENTRLQFSTEIFNLFNAENVVFNSTGGGTATLFGPGIDPLTGQVAPIDVRFQRLRLANGNYDPQTTTQQGAPLQVQFGLRLFF